MSSTKSSMADHRTYANAWGPIRKLSQRLALASYPILDADELIAATVKPQEMERFRELMECAKELGTMVPGVDVTTGDRLDDAEFELDGRTIKFSVRDRAGYFNAPTLSMRYESGALLHMERQIAAFCDAVVGHSTAMLIMNRVLGMCSSPQALMKVWPRVTSYLKNDTVTRKLREAGRIDARIDVAPDIRRAVTFLDFHLARCSVLDESSLPKLPNLRVVAWPAEAPMVYLDGTRRAVEALDVT